MGFEEVGVGVWVARYAWFDVNVTVVRGERGLLVVDTHASEAAARQVVADVRALGAGEVVEVVNTHEHFDHCFGNGTFRTAFGEVPITAHETAAASMRAFVGHEHEYSPDSPDARAAEIRATALLPADRTFSSALAVDLGDRLVELAHPGRGHTGGDLVVRVPDVDVVVVGDLIEESGPPGYGADCFPLEWPATLDVVLGLVSLGSVVVPGHGAPVDRTFVEDQRGDIGVVAGMVRDLAARGVPLEEALRADLDWPFPPEGLTEAVRRGYAQLSGAPGAGPGGRRSLPLA